MVDRIVKSYGSSSFVEVSLDSRSCRTEVMNNDLNPKWKQERMSKWEDLSESVLQDSPLVFRVLCMCRVAVVLMC